MIGGSVVDSPDAEHVDSAENIEDKREPDSRSSFREGFSHPNVTHTEISEALLRLSMCHKALPLQFRGERIGEFQASHLND